MSYTIRRRTGKGIEGAPDRIARRIATIATAKPVEASQNLRNPASKRKESRQAVFRQGKLTVTGGVRLDCIIVDTSPNGACVGLDGASSLPDLVTLKNLLTGESRRSRVMWRRDNAAGLSFQVERQYPFGGGGAR
jgi:hypothetical protein